MAKTPEGRVKDAIKAWLKAQGAWYFMPVPSGFGVHGIPDFICCIQGRFVAIEAKAPGKRKSTTSNQDDRIAEIIEAGGYAIVVDDVAQLKPLEVYFADPSPQA